MKKSSITYDCLLDFNELEKSYKTIKSKTKHKKKLISYELFLSTNLMSLYKDLENRKYKHQAYNIFFIRDPKYRIIMSEKIKDRVLNLFVTNKVLIPVLEPKLLDCNTATRIGKGTSYAFNLCKKYLHILKREYNDFYILKFDIKKYFYNIDHNILIEKLSKIIIDKDLIELLTEIINSTDSSYVNEQIIKVVQNEIKRLEKSKQKEAKDRIEELKRIPLYEKGKGLAIGNVTSQMLAVFYLSDLDHFIKEKLKCKYYIRYMDDGVVIDASKERLLYVKTEIEKKLKELGLFLNNKTYVYKISSGFSFLGYRFILKNNRIIIRISNVTKKRIKRKYKKFKIYDEDKLVRVMASYNGYLMVANTGRLKFNLESDS